jgi:hypothetical protein
MKPEYIKNPIHQLPEQIQRALDYMLVTRTDALAEFHRVAIESRPTAEERQQINALLVGESHAQQSAAKKMKEILTSYRDRVRLLERTGFTTPLDPVAEAPEALGADFWWANTVAFPGGGLGVQFMTDGLHFFGRINYNRDQLFSFSTRAVATFELQPNRRPPSPSGRYNSAPHVELFGDVSGWTNSKICPLACDDKWCKCFLFLRQTAFQIINGQGRVCGENMSHRTLINEEGQGRDVSTRLPGFLQMPFLQFGLLRADLSVFIDLEVRFDVQLEGDSNIWFSPKACCQL